MAAGLTRPVNGHVFRIERKRGPIWYAKYRLPDGRQMQKWKAAFTEQRKLSNRTRRSIS
jgi:hypothetical protein